jgi:hypothetical protein
MTPTEGALSTEWQAANNLVQSKMIEGGRMYLQLLDRLCQLFWGIVHTISGVLGALELNRK